VDPKERQVIDDLFGKLRQVEGQSPQRDPEAEAHIARQVANVPAAPYYMAQAILAQEQALASTQSRVQQLEQQLAQRPRRARAAAAGSSPASSAVASRRRRHPRPDSPCSSSTSRPRTCSPEAAA
jgi:hypothetical protein